VVIAIALALGASLVYGLSDFLGGLKSRSLPQLSVLLVSQGGALAVLIAVVTVLGADPPSARFLLYGALAGLAEAVGVAALYRGLAVGTMSIVAPVAATAPVVPLVAGIALGELPTPIQGAGIALALAGVTMLSLAPPGRRATSGVGASVLFGLLTALGFGGFLAAVDAASEGGVAWALLVARIVTVAAFAAVALIGRPNLRIRPAELPVLVGIGTLILVADAMYAVASTQGLLPVVAVLSSLYPVVTIALAHCYLDERIERLQPLGIAVALGGAAAISAASA
jgi:drug/metabolite transporter (DMT)-like permease